MRKSEIRNPKSEIRNKFEAEKRKVQNAISWFWSFLIWVLYLFRIPDFGFRISAAFLLLTFAASASAATARVDLYPPDIQLRSSFARQQIVVVATRPDGVTEDVTAKAKIAMADGRIARFENGTVYPTANGQTTLQAQYDGQSASTPLAVQDVAVVRPVSFRRDVMPVFMRAGCNTGACHGSARGKDGFRLSLFGFDPEGDYFRLTRELGYRRVNLAVPEDSLVLQKALGAVPHTGGKRFEPSSEYAKTLLDLAPGRGAERSARRADRGKRRDLPARDALGRGRRQAADDRPCPL